MVAKIRGKVSSGMANAVFGRWLGNRIFGACYFCGCMERRLICRGDGIVGLVSCNVQRGVATDILDLSSGWPAAQVKAENISAHPDSDCQLLSMLSMHQSLNILRSMSIRFHSSSSFE